MPYSFTGSIWNTKAKDLQRVNRSWQTKPREGIIQLSGLGYVIPLFSLGFAMVNDTNVKWHEHQVSRDQRESLNGHRGCVIWFTGLSGSGKSTIANALDHKLFQNGIHSAVLDGDNVRHTLNAGPGMLKEVHGDRFAERFGLGFSAIDREENIRRIGAVAQLFAEAGIIALTAFISPYRVDRERVRNTLRAGDFIEVFVDTPIDICESRDPKGLYKKARAGLIKGFTGIDDPYEAPESPEINISAAVKTPDELADDILAYLRQKGICQSSAELQTRIING